MALRRSLEARNSWLMLAGGHAWRRRSADRAVLVINPIIYAELSVGIETIAELDQFLGTDFQRDALS